MRRITTSLIAATLVVLAVVDIGGNAFAQEPTLDVARLRAGIFGGASYNYVDAPVQRFIGSGSDPRFGSREYSGATATVPFGGIMAEVLVDDRIGMSLRTSYDIRTVATTVDGSELSVRLTYISYEGAVRLNLVSGLHLNVGPSLSIPVARTYSYAAAEDEGTTAVTDARLQNLTEMSIGAWGGFGYDIPLDSHGAVRWYVTPFVEGSWIYDQKNVDATQPGFDATWNTLSARAGVQLTFGAEATAEPPTPSANAAW